MKKVAYSFTFLASNRTVTHFM